MRWVSSPDSSRQTGGTSQWRRFTCSPTLQGLPPRLLPRDQKQRTTPERLCQQQPDKGKEMGNVKPNIFINISHKEIKVINGEGKPLL